MPARLVASFALTFPVLLTLPVGGLAVTLGLRSFRSDAIADLSADADVVDRSLAVLESWDVEVEPLRELMSSLPTTYS